VCTKEQAQRARTAAYKLLLDLVEAIVRWRGDQKGELTSTHHCCLNRITFLIYIAIFIVHPCDFI
jgi:hypothetical protein